MVSTAVALALIAAAPPSATGRPLSSLTAYIRDRLHISTYRIALADLNSDQHPEALVYATGRERCGTGGCPLFILTPARSNYRVVVKVSITRPPIRLLPTSSHGWRDIGVFVAGGGIIPGYNVRLRFDGYHYPSNPSLSPAIRLRGSKGTTLIAR